MTTASGDSITRENVRQYQSCAIPLLKLCDHFLTKNGNNLDTAAVFLDLKGAFDTQWRAGAS